MRWSVREMATTYAALIWATARYFRQTPRIHSQMTRLLDDLHGEFGLKARISAMLFGRYALRRLRQEQRRLEEGWTYEPPTFYETNHSNRSTHRSAQSSAAALRSRLA
jgi:hypothetical protein